jgi:DNA-binding beta-propeller fold protein YncE
MRLASLLAAAAFAAPGAHLVNPEGLALDARGRILVADGSSGQLLRIDPRTRRITLLASARGFALDPAVAPDGTVYVVVNRALFRLEGRTLVRLPARGIGLPFAMVRLPDGDFVFADIEGSRIVRLHDGVATPISSGWRRPHGLALARDGSLLVADTDAGGRIVRLSLEGTQTLVARVPGTISLAEAPDGSIVVAETSTNTVRRVLPGGKVRKLGTFIDPSDVVVAPNGTIYVAEHDGVRVRAISPRGAITTVAG